MYSYYGSGIDNIQDALRSLNGLNYTVNAFSSFINLVILVMTIISFWFIFEKANEAGWKSLIPFYNSYVMYKISGKKNLFWIWLVAIIVDFIAIIGVIVAVIFLIASIFSNEYDWALPLLIGCSILSLASGIAALVVRILQCVGLTKAFRISAGYAVGLVLIPVVFYCIIAFNSNMKYYGLEEDYAQNIPTDPSNPYFQ
jgi:hypothetical protein